MVLGWDLSNKQVKILSNKYMMVAGLLLFIIATLTSFYFVDNGLPFGTEYKVSLIPALQGLGLYLFVEYFDAYSKSDLKSTIGKFYSFLKDSFIGKIILSISLCSYGMYLTHYLQF